MEFLWCRIMRRWWVAFCSVTPLAFRHAKSVREVATIPDDMITIGGYAYAIYVALELTISDLFLFAFLSWCILYGLHLVEVPNWVTSLWNAVRRRPPAQDRTQPSDPVKPESEATTQRKAEERQRRLWRQWEADLGNGRKAARLILEMGVRLPA